MVIRRIFFSALKISGTLSVLLLFFNVYNTASAAYMYFEPNSVNVYRGDTVKLNLRIDTDQDECVNTVSAVIKYDPAVKAVDVSRGSSILNLWVQDPIIDAENHTITFVGGIPGGYCGRIPGDPSLTNVLAELVFRSPGFSIGTGGDTPVANVWVDTSSQVLLHDGLGTIAPLRVGEAQIVLENTPGTAPSDTWRDEVQGDTDLPSDFTITLSRDETAFSGNYFIVFNALDKQSGIDHYEVMEEPIEDIYAFKWGRADAPWTTEQSPYVLKDQSLNSTIWVKAIDKAGNERIVKLVPDTALRSISRDRIITVLIIGGVIVIVVCLAFFALWKRRQRLTARKEGEVNDVLPQ